MRARIPNFKVLILNFATRSSSPNRRASEVPYDQLRAAAQLRAATGEKAPDARQLVAVDVQGDAHASGEQAFAQHTLPYHPRSADQKTLHNPSNTTRQTAPIKE